MRTRRGMEDMMTDKRYGLRQNNRNLFWREDLGCWEMELTQGKRTIFDEQDLPELLKRNWCTMLSTTNHKFYAFSRSLGKSEHMARVIMESPQGKDIDHIDGNTLDNRRSNLRVATRQQNISNKRRQSNNTSGYKGVRVKKKVMGNRYEAHIKAFGETHWLGTYATAEEAAKKYNEKALYFFGEFALLNKIP